MRKLCVLIALIIVISGMNSVSAMTTGKWDLAAGQRDIQHTVQQMISQNVTNTDNTFSWYIEYINQLFAEYGK